MRINEKGILINYSDDPEVTRLVIPDTVKKIAPHAFYGAEYLEEVVISGGVREIGAEAFRGCPELRSVTMPDSVELLGKKAFTDCRFLAEVRLSAGLKDIPDNAFDCCHALTSVYIPDGVETIGFDAFNSCVGLRSVRLPDTLTFIDNGAFMETFSLKSISIPDGVEDIGSYTFFRSGLERVSYRGMEIYLDRVEEGSHTFEFCFTRELPKWLERCGTGRTCMPAGLKAPFLLAYFAKTRDPKAGEYVKKNFSKLFTMAVRTDNIPAVRAVIEEGGFLSSRNIGRYITLAAEMKRHEIYLMLVSHKDTLGTRTNNSARFRL